MGKWYGTVGFVRQYEDPDCPGVWKDEVTRKKYAGDIIRCSYRTQPSENLHDNLTVSNRISIIADPFANENVSNIRYVEFMGANWKVTEVEANYPKLILSVGGVYNGQT